VKRGVPSSRGLSRGEVADSSGEVGGEGESRGSDIVSVLRARVGEEMRAE
jgi:hypothetical protein